MCVSDFVGWVCEYVYVCVCVVICVYSWGRVCVCNYMHTCMCVSLYLCMWLEHSFCFLLVILIYHWTKNISLLYFPRLVSRPPFLILYTLSFVFTCSFPRLFLSLFVSPSQLVSTTFLVVCTRSVCYISNYIQRLFFSFLLIFPIQTMLILEILFCN